MFSFKEKSVIVTGSSRGIGKEIARAFLREGAFVTINGRNEERLEKARKELGKENGTLIAIQGDVTDPEFCHQLIKQTRESFGKINVLINNAGQSIRGLFEDIEPSAFRKIIELNLLSTAFCTKAVLPEIKKTRGSIIFVSSLAGIRGLPNNAPYSASKMALTALSQSLRVELADEKVHIGLLRVGLVKNPPGKKVLDEKGNRIDIHRGGDQTTKQVAEEVRKMVQKRRKVRNLTLLGKSYNFVNRICPPLIELIILKTRKSERYQ